MSSGLNTYIRNPNELLMGFAHMLIKIPVFTLAFDMHVHVIKHYTLHSATCRYNIRFIPRHDGNAKCIFTSWRGSCLGAQMGCVPLECSNGMRPVWVLQWDASHLGAQMRCFHYMTCVVAKARKGQRLCPLQGGANARQTTHCLICSFRFDSTTYDCYYILA
jgi:hypothetical protein